jgi:hypothetical protein
VKTTLTLVKLLKSTVSITPEPLQEIPGELQPDPNEDGSGNPLLPDPFGDGCPFDAPANGPFDLLQAGPAVLYNYGPLRTGTYSLPCVIRNNVHTYRTLLNWTAVIETTPDNGRTWYQTSASPTFIVRAVNNAGQTVATASNLGTGQYRFEIPANVTASGFVIEVSEGAGVYAAGDVITSGTVDGVNAAGIEVTGLVAGGSYCVDGTGGPYQFENNPAKLSYSLKIGYDSGYTNASYFGYDTESGMVLITGWAARTEAISANYGRSYFQALSTSFWVCVGDNINHDNSGSTGYIFRNAIVTGNTRITFTSLTVRNICPVA